MADTHIESSRPELPLRPPGSDASLSTYVRQLFSMRRYAWVTARYELEYASSGTLLGRLWLLLEPALLIAIYWLLFGFVLDVSRGTQNFVAFLTVGTVVFDHSRTGISSASAALVRNKAILRSFSFPRAVLPLTEVFRAFVNTLFSYVVMVLVLPIMGVRPSWGWLTLIPLLVVQVIMNYGIGLLLARPMTRFADLRQAIPYIFRLLFYGSGVLFPIDIYLKDRPYGDLLLDVMTLNPLYSIVHLVRWGMLDIRPESVEWMMVSVSSWSVLSLVIGLPVFLRGERSFSGVRTVMLDDK